MFGVILLLVFPGWTEPIKEGEPLQAALEVLPSGATLELGPGVWVENLRITKSVVLKGADPGETVIRGAAPGYPVIAISGDGDVSVKLIGLTIAGAGGRKCADQREKLCPHGILVQGEAKVEIVDCEVVGNVGSGLLAEGHARVTVAEATFSQNGQAGVWVHGEAQLSVASSEITDNYYGLIASAWAAVTVRKTRISDNERDGVLIADGSRVYLWDNEITHNGRVGICVDIPGCYRTKRSFTGIVRGEGNELPREGETMNRVAPYCPKALAPLATEFGGIYPPPSPDELFAGFPVLGSPDAPLALIEFSDFSCPFCTRFALEVLPRLREEYIDTGKVRLFFLPLPVHGDAARKEAEAALCAAEQGLFWTFHDAVFAYSDEEGLPAEFDPELVASILASVGGDPERLRECLSSGAHAQEVGRIDEIARELGVTGTPTFFLGNWSIPGAYPFELFRQFIDVLLRRNG